MVVEMEMERFPASDLAVSRGHCIPVCLEAFPLRLVFGLAAI